MFLWKGRLFISATNVMPLCSVSLLSLAIHLPYYLLGLHANVNTTFSVDSETLFGAVHAHTRVFQHLNLGRR